MAQSAPDALSRAMTALDHALVAVQEARALVGAAIIAATVDSVAERVVGNLKPAPFFMTEGVVRSLVEPEAPAGLRTVDVPVAAEPLIDQPRRSEDPRLTKANDDVPEVSSDDLLPPPGETIRSGEDGARVAASGNLPVPETATHPIPSPEPASGRAPATAKKLRRGKLGTNPKLSGGAPREFRFKPASEGEPARKADVMHRQAKDRDARELEQPVDRMELIRAAAQKLALPAKAADFRPSVGSPASKPAVPIPPLPVFARRQRLQAAIMFLKRQCILVSPVDRSALVMRYRVSGKRESLMAEGVIAFAIERGFQAEEQASC